MIRRSIAGAAIAGLVLLGPAAVSAAKAPDPVGNTVGAVSEGLGANATNTSAGPAERLGGPAGKVVDDLLLLPNQELPGTVPDLLYTQPHLPAR
ncbi:hypothetical protein [Sinosporangium siamense]|uniref:Secreted protein n=1 Tax=Sinosporangium siamense TaxID=1367973 RepID=A0A919VE50_9ACTN|nr:hypothetical protein [Sinosporangium siamense]GII94774.1 hypothetical protein Ssi02_50050 [Sinosporangium siamense]